MLFFFWWLCLHTLVLLLEINCILTQPRYRSALYLYPLLLLSLLVLLTLLFMLHCIGSLLPFDSVLCNFIAVPLLCCLTLWRDGQNQVRNRFWVPLLHSIELINQDFVHWNLGMSHDPLLTFPSSWWRLLCIWTVVCFLYFLIFGFRLYWLLRFCICTIYWVTIVKCMFCLLDIHGWILIAETFEIVSVSNIRFQIVCLVLCSNLDRPAFCIYITWHM